MKCKNDYVVIGKLDEVKSRCRLPLEDVPGEFPEIAAGAGDDVFGCDEEVKVCHLDESYEEWKHIKGI